jgi:hypothetical protein
MVGALSIRRIVLMRSKKKLTNGRNGKKRPRVVQSWRSFAEGRLMKAMAVKLHDNGLRGRALEQKFKYLVPHWKSYFDKPISDGAVSQRADKGRRYPSENPEHDPDTWRAAGRAVRADKPLGKRAMKQLAGA